MLGLFINFFKNLSNSKNHEESPLVTATLVHVNTPTSLESLGIVPPPQPILEQPSGGYQYTQFTTNPILEFFKKEEIKRILTEELFNKLFGDNEEVSSKKLEFFLNILLESQESTIPSTTQNLDLHGNLSSQFGSIIKSADDSIAKDSTKEKPQTYFGVGIASQLESHNDEKFLKITGIFSNNIPADHKDKFITHLYCKLDNDNIPKRYSIKEIFEKCENEEAFILKIQEIFRNLKEETISFDISKTTGLDKVNPADVEKVENIKKVFLEKSDDKYNKRTIEIPNTEISKRQDPNQTTTHPSNPVGRVV